MEEGREYVERRPDGELQWIRIPRRREYQPSSAWVRESRGRSSRAVADVEVIEIAPERDLQAIRLERNLPSFPDVERLLGLYVATGEGRGAYLAAKKEEEKKWGRDGRHGYRTEASMRRQRLGSRPHGPSPSSSESSDGHSDDEDDGLGGRPPHRPPSGGPSGGHPEAYIIRQDGRHRPSVRRGNRAWIPLQVIENGELRFLRAEEYDPNRQAEYRPYYPGAAYFNHRPRPIQRSRPSHVALEHDAEPVVPPLHGVPAGPAAPHHEFVMLQGLQGGQHGGPPPPPRRRPPPPPPVLHIRQDHIPQRYYQEAHRPPRPTVEDALEDEDDQHFASLPSEEDDIRLQRPSRQQSREVRNRVKMNPRSARTAGVIFRRGGDGTNHNIDEDSDEDAHQLVRMRGGGAEKPLSKTSSILANVVPKEDYSTVSKTIALYFFYTSRGKILSSRKPELYRTFQELGKNQPIVKRDQLSDQWLVAKLQQHYWMINRGQQSVFWDLIGMRTIGFATFIRFERTVKKGADAGNFIVTAKVPAISSQGEGVSQFLYHMKYPLQKAKMMLFSLDRLAGTTKDDDNCYYVVEIKETFDTSKIYVLLILLILISAGAGTAYAVVRSDPGTGLSMASFMLTCLSLTLALVAAGQWLGLSKPDSFSFAYDWEENRVLGSTDAGKIFGPGSGVM